MGGVPFILLIHFFSKPEEVTIEFRRSSVNGSINDFLGWEIKKNSLVLFSFAIVYSHTILPPFILSMDLGTHI